MTPTASLRDPAFSDAFSDVRSRASSGHRARFCTVLHRASLSALLVAAVGCARVRAAGRADHAITPDRSPYVAGELIVKLNEDAGQALDAALAAEAPPTRTGLGWFDTLNIRYGVRAIQPVLRNPPDPDELTRKYPQRARRAPPGALAPRLPHIYTLTMSEDAPVLQAVGDYAAQPDVEYAQPNYIASTQPEGGPAR